MSINSNGMTIARLLYEAGFFQWIGLLTLTSIIALSVVIIIAIICKAYRKQ